MCFGIAAGGLLSTPLVSEFGLARSSLTCHLPVDAVRTVTSRGSRPSGHDHLRVSGHNRLWPWNTPGRAQSGPSNLYHQRRCAPRALPRARSRSQDSCSTPTHHGDHHHLVSVAGSQALRKEPCNYARGVSEPARLGHRRALTLLMAAVRGRTRHERGPQRPPAQRRSKTNSGYWSAHPPREASPASTRPSWP